MSVSHWGIFPGILFRDHWRILSFDFWVMYNLRENR
jgi:hypothetical protein